ncbi:hypothetical protein LTR17_027407 [Elasticomyces elasticus]|nr:hypothetical protein LTR17_027407 [Elasticomyces elasticus]
MLPLGHPDALRIMTASHPAPFGRGLETLVDQSVRNTWELNHDQFLIHNPAFQDYVSTAIRDCCKGLGLENVNVQAQLYKLLLYEPGATFKPHTDTEKAPGMFGTMIISLPSGHHGGTLELSHNGLVKQFSTIQDVAQIQGYGVGFAMRFPTLEEAIRMWSRACAEEGDDTPALYALELQYTDASISLQSLKANDLAKAQALQQFAIHHNLVLYLASCEKEVSGDAEEGDDDYDGYSRSKRRRYGYDDYGETSDEYHQITYETESSLRIQRLVDVTGTELAQNLEIAEEDFLQDAPYEDRDPTEREHTGPTGNAGASATHWYRDTVRMAEPSAMISADGPMPVLVVVQTRQVVKSLLRGHSDDCRGAIMAFFDERVQHFVANRQDHQAAADVRTVCQYIFENMEYVGKETLEYAFRVLVWLITIYKAINDDLVRATNCCVGEKLSMPTLAEIGRLVTPAQFGRLMPIIHNIVKPYGSLGHRLEALKAILGPDLERADIPQVRALVLASVQQVVDQAACAPTSVSGPDGSALAEIALVGSTATLLRKDFGALYVARTDLRKHTNNFSILPTVIKHAVDTHFAVSFLAVWGSKAILTFDPTYAGKVYTTVSNTMLANIHVEFNEPPKSRTQGRGGATAALPRQDCTPQHDKFAEDLSIVWHHAADAGMATGSAHYIKTIVRDVGTVNIDLVRSIHLPFLRNILPDAVERLHTPLYADISHAYETILEDFLDRYVKPQPDASGRLSRMRVNCQCNRCWPVNLFLASSTQQVARFTLGHEELQNFDVDNLRKIIPMAYDEIMGMDRLMRDGVRRPDFLPAGRRAIPKAAAPVVAAGERSRGLEVINLCENSD